jgi:hypothetical protein
MKVAPASLNNPSVAPKRNHYDEPILEGDHEPQTH